MASETCGFSTTICRGDLDSLLTVTRSEFARLRLIVIRLPTREPNMTVLMIAIMDEYAT